MRRSDNPKAVAFVALTALCLLGTAVFVVDSLPLELPTAADYQSTSPPSSPSSPSATDGGANATDEHHHYLGRRSCSRDCDICDSFCDEVIQPAAHIIGSGPLVQGWSVKDDASRGEGHYRTRWQCRGSSRSGDAFVEGGMSFSESTLTVPKCGYYHVASQVYFTPSEVKRNDGSNPQGPWVFRHVTVVRPCPLANSNQTDFDSDDLYQLYAYSTIGAGAAGNDTTAYTASTIKMCAGGTVQVVIPGDVPCCARPQFSFIDAFLVSQAECD